jgi:acyl-CoA hydrolase/GNAT superfamily N-acetyltransferase
LRKNKTEEPMGYFDPKWEEKYQDQITTAVEAIGNIRPGSRIFISTGCAQPKILTDALVAQYRELSDTEIIQLFTYDEAPYASESLAHYFRINSFFISESVRELIREGLGEYTPIFLSDIPELLKSGQLPLDAALIHVTPPDDQGMCSLGVSVDISKCAAENASLVVAQVNPQMPRTHGDSMIHVHDLDYLVPGDMPILEYTPPDRNDVMDKLAEYVAALIDNGSTIEVGIGGLSNALIDYLKDKENLGIHTELVTDSIIDLFASGAISGARKSLDKRKIVTSFCMGSKRLYEFVDENPDFSFRPTEYVNDPVIIGRQHKQVAVNLALEVDLTGQVCSGSIGPMFYSGFGGQADFNRGAAMSNGGKAIVALPSTAKDGTVSRIVAFLSKGAGVVTTCADVQYVVTEYGSAYLHGKSIQERALALISIAHPDFRDQLLRDAIDAKYLHQRMMQMEGRINIGPAELRASYLLDDGTLVHFRPIHPTDPDRVKDLFYALSEESVYMRFMQRMKRLQRKQIDDLVYIDHRDEVVIVGTLSEVHGEDIIAMGGYYLDPKTNRAEVAFLVHDRWQRRGIGSFMFRHLTNIARSYGIAGFTAETLPQNRAMQHVFNRCGLSLSSSIEDGVYVYYMDF